MSMYEIYLLLSHYPDEMDESRDEEKGYLDIEPLVGLQIWHDSSIIELLERFSEKVWISIYLHVIPFLIELGSRDSWCKYYDADILRHESPWKFIDKGGGSIPWCKSWECTRKDEWVIHLY
jgi:hypothetical protein